VNRELRRLQAKEEERTKKRRQERPRQKRERVGFRQYIREVRQELKKVAWPSREELTTYTVVVVSTTTVLTLLIFAMDWAFKSGFFQLLETAG
jgi:preprotein translocase subunit SecE